jgi:hypothetical protein
MGHLIQYFSTKHIWFPFPQTVEIKARFGPHVEKENELTVVGHKTKSVKGMRRRMSKKGSTAPNCSQKVGKLRAIKGLRNALWPRSVLFTLEARAFV